MENSSKNLGFLQSAEWRKFQENVGHKAYFIENEGFSASIIGHELPIVGKYLYVPRGPVVTVIGNQELGIRNGIQNLVDLAKKENAGWIRIEPENEETLELIRNNISEKIIKSPHDMQPKEVFVMDILKPAEQLLAEMKSKTRYNIGVARKKNVKVTSHRSSVIDLEKERYVEEFLKLTKEMAARQGISAHPEEYYRKMIGSLPPEMLKIYAAEYDGKIIVANLVVFYVNTAIYLHGASSNEHRNVMAPYLLQWQAIQDAKERGCTRYDFGGVKTGIRNQESVIRNDWSGITNFKLGFSSNTEPVVFPGSYDIIINPRKYAVYRGLQKAKALLRNIRK
jgi:peptidoglycan pentaglycine glycine transferase (the first glycine)